MRRFANTLAITAPFVAIVGLFFLSQISDYSIYGVLIIIVIAIILERKISFELVDRVFSAILLINCVLVAANPLWIHEEPKTLMDNIIGVFILLSPIIITALFQKKLIKSKKHSEILHESIDESMTEKPRRTLTPYHWERRSAALKAVEEMAKHPTTLEQKKAQVKRLKNGLLPLKDQYLAGNKLTIRAIKERDKYPLTIKID